jgi:hypothetical protein
VSQIPTTQIRQPLFSPVAFASIVPYCAALVGVIAVVEFQGLLRYALLTAAVAVFVIGLVRMWRVVKRETERLR